MQSLHSLGYLGFNTRQDVYHLEFVFPFPRCLSSISICNYSSLSSKSYQRRTCNWASSNYNGSRSPASNSKLGLNLKGKKDNVWSIDNNAAEVRNSKMDSKSRSRRARKPKVHRDRDETNGAALVSNSMLVEVESVLQTQEPVTQPSWTTFASSLSGVWKGVGAAFSPISAQMEAVAIGENKRPAYDCFTLSSIDSSSGQITRKTNWVTFVSKSEVLSCPQVDFSKSDVMEEDVISNECGLAYFEDGSYSRGPLYIPVGDGNDSEYYLSPTFRFEQCIVKGSHKRLRIVHTIEFGDGGANIEILRVAVYEEKWVCPVNLPELSEDAMEWEPFSQRARTKSSELGGSWKVFEVSATPIFEEEVVPFTYFCSETIKRRRLLRNSVCNEAADMLWLPGGVTSYVEVRKGKVLCIGVGWYSNDGINLAMERDYDSAGNLSEVRYQSQLKI